MEISYVTSNRGKFEEANEIIPELKWLSIDLDEVQSLEPVKVVKMKAKEANMRSNIKNLVVDDASLYLEALEYKLPGPLIKWFLKSIGSKGIFDLVDRYGKYGVTAVCTLCYTDAKEGTKIFSGSVDGKVVHPKVNSFKSWDGIFQPDCMDITFAAMTLHEKNKISHRGKAMMKLREYLMS
jgi:inosine triphosphate pyrophosphatase